MSRPTTSQIIALGDYLEPDFDPTTLTIAHLLGILSYHQIEYPSPHKKADLVQLFNKEIKAKSSRLKKQRLVRQETAASEDGIIDGVSGLPISGQSQAEPEAPVRRSSRRLSREPSVEQHTPEIPKRRRSSAQPNLGRQAPKRGTAKEPVVIEESESEDDAGDPGFQDMVKDTRSKRKTANSSAPSRRVSQKFGPGTDDSGWEDNNIFQSGAESSSPLRPQNHKSTLRPGTKSRKSLSAPPEVEFPPKHSNARPSNAMARQEPHNTSRSGIASEMESEFIEGNSAYADVSTNIAGDELLSEDEDEDADDNIEEEQEEEPEDIQEVEAMTPEDVRNQEISTRIAKGGPRGDRSNGARVLSLQRAIAITVLLPVFWCIQQYRQESAAIGYCDAGTHSNSVLMSLASSRQEIATCYEQATNETVVECPPLPLVPLPHPTSCTPCPAHALCTPSSVTCDDGFILQPHLLSKAPYISMFLDGLPGVGPVAFPSRCVEDPQRKKNIGLLGKGIDKILATERGRRLCAGISDKPIDGGEGRNWGFDVEHLKEKMKADLEKINVDVTDFEQSFDLAVEELRKFGRIVVGHDSIGRMYLTTEHIDLSWTCRMTVAARGIWAQWRIYVYAVAVIAVMSFYAKNRLTARHLEAQRVAALVQIALEELRNQEIQHHTDPVTTPQPYLSSTQLRDAILEEEHSIPTRRRLWERVEQVVEGNANVRANLEELRGGDEARVWRWVGSSGTPIRRVPRESRADDLQWRGGRPVA